MPDRSLACVRSTTPRNPERERTKVNSNLPSLLLLFAASSCACLSSAADAVDRPNILWLSCEDISPHLGCYGDPQATTPNIDQLAKEGVRYSHAFTTAGVCAPCRSAIITGMYQTSLGTQHMRCSARLPNYIKPFPFYLREAGYYCTNNSKKDYQFKEPKGTWDESSGKAHWRNRPSKDQPFFASSISRSAMNRALPAIPNTTRLPKESRSTTPPK